MPEVAPVAVTGYLVDGEWLTTGAITDIYSPYDCSVAGRVVVASRANLERAIEASVRSFESTRRMSTFEKQGLSCAIEEIPDPKLLVMNIR